MGISVHLKSLLIVDRRGVNTENLIYIWHDILHINTQACETLRMAIFHEILSGKCNIMLVTIFIMSWLLIPI